MAPGMASTAQMMSESAFQQLANETGFGGGGKHHHHGGSGGGGGTDDDSFFSGSGNGTFGGSSGRQSVFLEILSRTSSQHRMGVIVTLAFSIVAALIVLYTIVRDAYRVPAGEVYSRAQKQSSIFKTLHPAEVFPFVISVAILIQSFIFLGVQVGDIDTFEVSGCRLTSELIWPTFFIVFFLIFTFSVETTVRALGARRFKPRGKFTTPICIAVVILFTIGLWMSAFFFPALDVCPASLSWWTLHYSKVGIILGAGLILAHFISGAIITLQLFNTADVSSDERIAASRVVYTMAINIIVISLILPFWIQIIIGGQSPAESSKVADIGITLTGMLFCAMHLFSRANAERFAIRPKNMPWSSDRKIRLFGSSDLHDRSNISAPLLEPKQSVRSHNDLPIRPLRPSVPNEPPPDYYMDPNHLSPVMPREFGSQEMDRPLPPQPAAIAPTHATHAGYTTEAHPGTPVLTSPPAGELFPPTHQRYPVTSTGSMEVPLPLPLFARHERNDSSYTSADIEIGLRLSRPITGMQSPRSPQELPARAMSEMSNGSDVEKGLPMLPANAYGQPALMTPGAFSPAPTGPKPSMPPPNIGIGALGHGPKGGLRPLAGMPQRTSPLANVIKAASPSPTKEKENPFFPPGRSPLAGTGSPHSVRSPQNLSPPAVSGLPRSPSPRTRTSEAAGASPVKRQALSPLQTAYSPSGTQSPTEWPAFNPSSPAQWPSGNKVDLPSPEEKRWA